MQFSESWLRTFVNPDCSSDALAHLLTMAGLEVEAMEAAAPAFSGVLTAEILSVAKHSDADRLNVCQVDAGDGFPRQIVCGAPNAAVGLKVPCALPDAVLPGGFRIKVAKVRGVQSCGMLCSARELGISEDAAGLLELPADAPPGQSIRDFLDLDDRIHTLKLTPNRADCLSLVGIAREVAALTGAPLLLPQISEVAVTASPLQPRAVHLQAPAACPRYCGRIIRGANAKAPTPEWMRRRLSRGGLRSISALVDITNYVMLTLGQPLHAFDDARLSGDIQARMATPGEKLLLLNGQEVTLTDDVLVIADAAGAKAMAGVMGGAESAVSLETKDIFLESAFFAPAAIAGRARRYNFSSDAAHRYERGVDWENCRNALEYASALILDICGGAADAITHVAAEAHLPRRAVVRLRPPRLAKVLGMPFRAAEITEYLTRLALPFTRESTDFLVTPPSYRFDIKIEEDLIEEIARVHGYENLPAPEPKGELVMLPQPENRRTLAKLRQQIADRGYQEVINYAFVPEEQERDFAANAAPVRLANPIASQFAVLRSSLLGSLVDNLVANLKRKQSRVRLFELGRCFAYAGEDYRQPWRMAMLAYGAVLPEGWGRETRQVDFFDLKGDVESLFAPAELSFVRAAHCALHPGRAADIQLAGQTIGHIGELHPQWAQKYELPAAPVLCELELEPMTRAALPVHAEVSRFQPAIRDLAVLVDQSLPAHDILHGMRQQAPKQVCDIQLFDLYQGKGVPAGRKSLAFRIVIQDTQRTLSDADIDLAVSEITAYLEQHFQAQLRT
ncbi:MAG: phenylalanine--tRNA ligase subunit beta [Zoogloeaceae bacterium]|jgi:phenylalanyl-tRNA synthetase beta chain|nr:phenylalanine--tRNA ligase subunit beta [Zoogloeaceae bacterium]